MSRTGILDIIVMFWALAAFVALLADRERTRGILADKVARMKIEGTWTEDKAAWSGPFLGLRPWRWVAGLCIGLDLATKWSGGFLGSRRATRGRQPPLDQRHDLQGRVPGDGLHDPGGTRDLPRDLVGLVRVEGRVGPQLGREQPSRQGLRAVCGQLAVRLDA